VYILHVFATVVIADRGIVCTVWHRTTVCLWNFIALYLYIREKNREVLDDVLCTRVQRWNFTEWWIV